MVFSTKTCSLRPAASFSACGSCSNRSSLSFASALLTRTFSRIWNAPPSASKRGRNVARPVMLPPCGNSCSNCGLSLRQPRAPDRSREPGWSLRPRRRWRRGSWLPAGPIDLDARASKAQRQALRGLAPFEQEEMFMFRVHAKNLGSVAIVCLQGRMVRGETAALRNAVHSQSEVSAVVLDLARVSTIDAGGLGVMLELREQAQSKGIAFKLINVTKLVRRVLEITRLDSVFEVTSVADILSAVSLGRRVAAMELAHCA